MKSYDVRFIIRQQRTLSNLAKLLLSSTAQKLIKFQRRTTVIEPTKQLLKKNSKEGDDDITGFGKGFNSEHAFAKFVHKQADLDQKTIRLQKGVLLRHGLSKFEMIDYTEES